MFDCSRRFPPITSTAPRTAHPSSALSTELSRIGGGRPGRKPAERVPALEVEPVGVLDDATRTLGQHLGAERGDTAPVDLWAAVMLLVVAVVEPDEVIGTTVAAHRVRQPVPRNRTVMLQVVLGVRGDMPEIPRREEKRDERRPERDQGGAEADQGRDVGPHERRLTGSP